MGDLSRAIDAGAHTTSSDGGTDARAVAQADHCGAVVAHGVPQAMTTLADFALGLGLEGGPACVGMGTLGRHAISRRGRA